MHRDARQAKDRRVLFLRFRFVIPGVETQAVGQLKVIVFEKRAILF